MIHLSEEELFLYSNGFLDYAQEREFEEHIINCDDCNEKYIEFIEQHQVERYSDQLSPQFTDNIMGIIELESKKNKVPKQINVPKKKKVIPEVFVYYVAAACITLVFSLNGVLDSLLVGVSDMTKSIAQSPVKIEKAISNGWTERLANDTSKVISELKPDSQE